MAARLHVLCMCLLITSACKLDEKPPVGGGLVVAIDTDMSMPKDVDEVRLEVTQGATMLFQHDQMLDDNAAKLPLEFQIPDVKDNTPVLSRAVGLKDGDVRVERSAITTVPTSYLGYVRLPLNYLCDGMVSSNGESSCGAEQTCIQGTCQSAAITSSLPDFFARDGSSTGMMQSASTACFDVAKCFSMATEMTPDPANGCSFESSKLFPTDINVALRLEPGSAGVCTRTACWVVLDSDADGFRIGNDDRVFLPEAICAQRTQGANLRVAMSMQCPSKKQGLPLCRDGADGSSNPGKPVTVGVGSPPVSDACAGGGARACAMCGSQGRMCQSGLWSEFGMCADQGVCEAEGVESCGVNGVRTCGGDCTWGDCESQTCDGPATRACGNCGTQHRSCNNGVWSEWSACGEEGVCMAGLTQACGSSGTQACMGNCAWGDCTMQVCDGAASAPCGNCGTHTRVCDSNTATWSDWGACEEEGECRPDSTMACGRDGEQTCGGNCRWDVGCNGQTCEGPARRACGLCGTQTRTCDMMTGEYSDWSACFGEGECMPDSLASCGSGGERSCGGNCRWGAACTGQTCTGASSERCGDCGTRTRTCNTNSGAWSDWSACSNEGDCSAGETRTCGAGGTQTCSSACRWNAACPGQMCDGPTTRECPTNPCGRQTRTCDTGTGMWNSWGTCSMTQPGCRPGQSAQRQCGTSGQETCTDMCTWPGECTCMGGLAACGSTCVDRQTDENNCGTCGTVCPVGQTCEAGLCACPVGQTRCGDQCFNLNTTTAHCGSCTNSCGDGAGCEGGACLCPMTGGVRQAYCVDGNVKQCVNLQNDNENCGECGRDCTGGRMCVAGMCQCPSGRDTCGGTTCLDLATDEAHCGTCANACTAPDMCIGGMCRVDCTLPGEIACGRQCVNPMTNAQHCGACGNACMNGMTCQAGACACPAGTMQCGGAGSACVPLNTTTNCGTCGNACGGGAMCSGGMCGCPTGQTNCGGTCVDTQTDENHCGACPTVCPTGATCSAGTCDCPGEESECNRACVDTITDENNCGRCGMVCQGTTCNGGLCGCPTGQTLCGSTCVNLQIDETHCGRCDIVCDGTMCNGGACACPAGQRRCTDQSCQARSAQSCGPACGACPVRANAVATGCSAQDECQYSCSGNAVECNGACCSAGQECIGGACGVRPPDPPRGGAGGGPNQGGSGGVGSPIPPID